MESSIALNQLRPSSVAVAIESIQSTEISLYVHGAPGIAKSAVARQVADRLGIAFIDVRLSQMAPEDVRGIPMLGELDGMKGVIWQPPLSFPRNLDYTKTEEVQGLKTIRFFNPIGNNGIHYCTQASITIEAVDPFYIATITEQSVDRFDVTLRTRLGEPVNGMVRWQVTGPVKAILALEEFNSAPPSVMAAAYQLVWDRRLGDYLVPDDVMIVAMGNRDIDKGVTYKLSKPVGNRFLHLEMVVNFDDFYEWAINHAIHPDVLGYLMKWQSKLFDEKFASQPDPRFATPRTWEGVSKICYLELTSTEVIRALVCGLIGDSYGTEFLLHRQFMEDMPDVRDILSGKVKTFHPKNPRHTTQIAYSLCIQICYALKGRSDDIAGKYRSKQEVNKSSEQMALWDQTDCALGYIIDNFPPEIAIMFQRIAMQTYKLSFNTTRMKRFAGFAEQYRDVVLG